MVREQVAEWGPRKFMEICLDQTMKRSYKDLLARSAKANIDSLGRI